MSLSLPLTSPLYEGGGASTQVPGLYDCAVNGRTFMFDWKYLEEFTDESIRLLKPQQDSDGATSERSLNPEDFPRRGIESWHKGAGQAVFDRTDSSQSRFRSSKGINPWERWELSLLNSTSQGAASANSNLYLAAAGSRLYFTDAATLKFSATALLASPTTVTGTPAGTITSIASDGFNVWIACTANGLYTTTRSISTASQLVTTALSSNSVVAYLKGRLMVSKDNAIYNVTSTTPAALPAALFTQANTDFVWTGFAEGLGNIYACGYSGDKSLIYKTAVVTDGTALAAPSVAGELPDGEIIRSIQGYLGFILLGTDQGVRFAVADSNGNLTIGALIDLNVSVRCFEGQDRFVWFGWTNYDATSTGLGRLDLSELNGSAPAYASDLMVTGQGTVLSVVSFTDKRVFSVSGLGFYAEGSTPVASGTLDSGLITFGFPDPKVAMYLDLRHEPLVGSVAMSLSSDGGAFTAITTSDEVGSTSKTVSAGQGSADTHEVRLTLATSTTTPTVTRVTLEANPAPGRGEFFTVPLLLWEDFELANGTRGTMDPRAEKNTLVAAEVAGVPITFQAGMDSFTVLLDDHKFIRDSYTKDRTAWNGTFLARFRKPRSRT